MIVWYALAFIFCIILSCEYYSFKTGVPTIATFPSARKKIIEILKSTFPGKSDSGKVQIIDLGSGSGQLTWHIARALPHAQVIGIEISYFPWLRSVLRQRLFGPSNLKYQRTDFWAYDCSHVDCVVTYLTENIIERVSAKLRSELKNGAVVLANDTALRAGWNPVEEVDTGFLKMKIFVYRQV